VGLEGVRTTKGATAGLVVVCTMEGVATVKGATVGLEVVCTIEGAGLLLTGLLLTGLLLTGLLLTGLLLTGLLLTGLLLTGLLLTGLLLTGSLLTGSLLTGLLLTGLLLTGLLLTVSLPDVHIPKAQIVLNTATPIISRQMNAVPITRMMILWLDGGGTVDPGVIVDPGRPVDSVRSGEITSSVSPTGKAMGTWTTSFSPRTRLESCTDLLLPLWAAPPSWSVPCTSEVAGSLDDRLEKSLFAFEALAFVAPLGAEIPLTLGSSEDTAPSSLHWSLY
jgi:hypothetical protein